MRVRRTVLNALLLGTNALAMTYFLGVAAPVYVSESRFVVDNTAGDARGGLAGLLKSGVYSTGGGYVVQSYIGSWEAMEHANKAVSLTDAFGKGDVVNRYGGLLHPRHDFLTLWRMMGSHVEDQVDERNSVNTLRTFAYSPQDARALNQALLDDSRTMLNTLNDHEVEEATRLSRAAVAAARIRLGSDEKAMASLRNQTGEYDPAAQNQTDIGMLATIEGKLLNDKGRLAALESSTPGSPLIPGLRAAIGSEEAVLKARSADVSGSRDSLSSKDAAYADAKAAEAVDLDILRAAELQNQAAEGEAAKHKFELDVLSPPNEPGEPQRPWRILDCLGVLLVTLLLWSLLR